MKQATINALADKIEKLIQEKRRYVRDELELAKSKDDTTYWTGYSDGLDKARRSIETMIQEYAD